MQRVWLCPGVTPDYGVPLYEPVQAGEVGFGIAIEAQAVQAIDDQMSAVDELVGVNGGEEIGDGTVGIESRDAAELGFPSAHDGFLSVCESFSFLGLLVILFQFELLIFPDGELAGRGDPRIFQNLAGIATPRVREIAVRGEPDKHKRGGSGSRHGNEFYKGMILKIEDADDCRNNTRQHTDEFDDLGAGEHWMRFVRCPGRYRREAGNERTLALRPGYPLQHLTTLAAGY